MPKSWIWIFGVLVMVHLIPLEAEEKIDPKKLKFDEPPFINAALVQDLQTWISDTEEQVVSINLETNHSNRYFRAMIIRNSKLKPVVYTEEDSPEFKTKSYFSYSLVGKTEDDIHVLKIKESGGGSGVFVSILLVALEDEQGMTLHGNVMGFNRSRRIIKRLGAIDLCEGYSGEVTLDGRTLHLGEHKNDRGDIILQSKDIHIERRQHGW